MFWRSIKNALGFREEPVTPDANNVSTLSQRIDARLRFHALRRNAVV
jgi:hypothetical protein